MEPIQQNADYGIGRMAETVMRLAFSSFASLSNDINELVDDDDMKQNEGEGDLPAGSNELSEFQKLKAKKMELLEELERIREREKQVLSRLSGGKYIDNGREELQKGPLPEVKASPRKARYQRINPIANEKAPIPIMAREDFEKNVAEIANNIRARVKKTGTESPAQKNYTWSKSMAKNNRNKQSNFGPQVPILDRKLNKLNEIYSGNETASKMSSRQANSEEQVNCEQELIVQSQSQRIAREMVKQMIKLALNKIAYKQKYGIKLDPVKHSYPMTIFRKRIIEERAEKSNKKRVSESLRRSMLQKRKDIFEGSRIYEK